MIDLRPVGYVVGLLVAALGLTMLVPMATDFYYGSGHALVFLEAALIATLTGAMTALACANGVSERLTIQQTFLLTTLVWLALPIFGALPFALGDTNARFVDAFFEAMSGLTTTGATVLSDLDQLPPGLQLWRAMMQWFGGIGIIVVAMVFLPELRVGGMQIFRSEGFDTLGKVLPRAAEISSQISVIYFTLTLLCALAYIITGMSPFDAICHAMTTVSTGGFGNYDGSFSGFNASTEYVAVIFMWLAALPFVRYVQLVAGSARPLFEDPQVRGFFAAVAVIVSIITLFLWVQAGIPTEFAFRKALFNTSSIITGTGYASDDYNLWGTFPVVLIFFAGLIGGCAGSTSCSIKIFRFQLLFSAIRAQIQRIHSPHGMFTPRYAGRTVGEDVLNSVMSFFVLFIVSLGILAVLLSATGLDFITSVSGAASALANIGPGLGDVIGPAENYQSLNDTAKWLLAIGMLVGRLELMSVYVILTVAFWRTS